MSTTKICPNCEAEREFRRQRRTEEYRIRGEKISIPVDVEVCAVCKEARYEEARDQQLMERVYAEYRERKGLLSPQEIREVRKRYGLSQKSFAALLGMSEATINRYEGGGLQDEAHDTAIRAQAKPESMAELLARKGDLLTDGQRRKVQKALGAAQGNLLERVKSLYRRLREAGLKKKYLQDVVLPTWWVDEEVDTIAAFEQALRYVSDHLGLDLPSLAKEGKPIMPAPLTCKYKLRNDTSEDALGWTAHLATTAATLACQAIPVDPIALPSTAREIRSQILREGAQCVNLDILLDFCWSHAIPVLHISRYPAGSRKMDGLAGWVGDRPAIVISKNTKYSAWLLFILAHELGHIVLGHIETGGVIVDDRVDRYNTATEEKPANDFAVELLTGKRDTKYVPTSHRLPAAKLASDAQKVGEDQGVDPGVVVMNYAWGQVLLGVGNAALGLIEPQADAPGLMRKKMLDYLDWDKLPEETARFLCRITQAE